MRSFGLEVETGIGKTGVVASLHGALGPGPAIGIRAEMDALPMTEASDVPYCSRTPGQMHGCGHDGHSAILLATARRLAAAPEFRGTVRFIFQPAEECFGGAKVMLEDGFLERFDCDSLWALHNWPGLPLGTIGARSGPMLAAMDSFDVTIDGRGGHAGLPHQSIDPIAAGAQFTTNLYAQIARRVDAVEGGLCSVTRFEAGSAYNVIPSSAKLAGTVRALYEPARELIESVLRDQTRAASVATGAEFRLDYHRGYPACVNDAASVDTALECARDLLGADQVVEPVPPSMGTEDFAYFLRERPGCFVLLGQGEGPEPPKLHTPNYDFNDKAIPIGVGYWLSLVDRLLGRRP